MKVAIVSDIHVEYGDIEIKNTENADLLIMAGDITVIDSLTANGPDGRRAITKSRTIKLFDDVSKEFEHVVVTIGNHEHYHGNWVADIEYYRHFLSTWSNVHLLENNSFEVNDVLVLGCTLWTDMQRRNPLVMYSMRDYMNDYRLIRVDTENYRRLRPEDTVNRHIQSLEWLRTELEKNTNKKVLVVTHHAPSFQSIHEKYRTGSMSDGNAAYYSDLDGFIMNHGSIKGWIHGHVHESMDYMIDSCRVVANPRGYKNFEPIADTWTLKYIEI